MRIYYGIWITKVIDVTDVCIEKLSNNNIITIPKGDSNRAAYLTDPLVGVHKQIIIENNGMMYAYDEYTRKPSTIRRKLKNYK